MKRGFGRVFLFLALVATGAAPLEAVERPDTTVRPPTAVTRHVVVISVDGLRPDAIQEFGLRTLQRLMDQGSYSLHAQTILPSKTLPSHTSMLTGVTPAIHGITFNREMEAHGIVDVPTMFEIARARGYHTAAFFSKAKFRHLDREGAYDYRQAPSSNVDNWMATRTVPEAVQYMRHQEPNLLFVHISETDYAGHGAGWMSYVYGVAARRADAGVARVLEAAEEVYGPGNFTLIVTADHGGHDRDHGSDDPRDTTIPWIVYGQGVVRGVQPQDVRTMDTAATSLWLLGIDVPASFQGRAVREALQPAAMTASSGG